MIFVTIIEKNDYFYAYYVSVEILLCYHLTVVQSFKLHVSPVLQNYL